MYGGKPYFFVPYACGRNTGGAVQLDAANHSAREHEEAMRKEEEALRAELDAALAAQPDAVRPQPFSLGRLHSLRTKLRVQGIGNVESRLQASTICTCDVTFHRKAEIGTCCG